MKKFDKPKAKQPNVDKEYRRITGIGDPIEALDECRAIIAQAKKEYWQKTRTHLGVLAETYERISRKRASWNQLTKKNFWTKAHGNAPTRKDRSDGLFFVIRYGERAITHAAYQIAWRHTVIVQLHHDRKPRKTGSPVGSGPSAVIVYSPESLLSGLVIPLGIPRKVSNFSEGYMGS
jgi:hypothetical protein